MRSSEQVNEIGGALAKAQGIMANAVINKVNPHFKSKYADLAAIREAVSGPLAQNGIAVLQVIDSDDKGSFLVTRLVHSSGQWIESVHPLPATAKPQEFGSALTYARRYSLAAICGISAEEDDDANAANVEPMQTVRAPSPALPRTAAPASKTATSPAAEWAGNQSTYIRTLSAVQISEWEKKNDPTMTRLKTADPKAFEALEAVIADRRGELRNFGIAAE